MLVLICGLRGICWVSPSQRPPTLWPVKMLIMGFPLSWAGNHIRVKLGWGFTLAVTTDTGVYFWALTGTAQHICESRNICSIFLRQSNPFIATFLFLWPQYLSYHIGALQWQTYVRFTSLNIAVHPGGLFLMMWGKLPPQWLDRCSNSPQMMMSKSAAHSLE